jgi:immune inhibitor A
MEPSCSVSCAIVTIFLIILACLCVCIGLAFFLMAPGFEFNYDPFTVQSRATSTVTPMVIRPVPSLTPITTPSARQGSLQEPGDANDPIVSSETLLALQDVIVPIRDLNELAFSLRGIDIILPTLEPPPVPNEIGANKVFWATNTDTNENFMVQASLAYMTEHLYFWIEDGVRYDFDDLKDLAETFENEIYPTNRAFFGSEWTPGIDGDPRLYILYAGGLGTRVAGYFSSSDSYHPQAHPYSNGHEMFFINSDHYRLRDPYIYGVLAHEFQHMIHWHIDRNEESWLNEGFSELAVYLNGYYYGGFDERYARDTDIQLNLWPNNPRNTTPHYGASFLFVAYFLDRFGEDATKALVAQQENGLNSIDIVLDQMGFTESTSGSLISGDDFFSDWAVANYLSDAEVADGRYTYSLYPDAPKSAPTETIKNCPLIPQTHSVNQYGVDYISIRCPGEYLLRFEGSTTAQVVPAVPYSGEYYFWSNRGDESNMTLTRTFAFSDHSGPLTLSYWTWYDIEKDYDYLYVLASPDGERWEFLNIPSGTDANPSGNSYGRAYNGLSGNGPRWIQEQVDLSEFTGQEIHIRFKYVTDAAVNGEGFLLDDVAIPETGYFTDFEQDDGGWQGSGFVRMQNKILQTYRLSLISYGDQISVEHFTPSEDQTLEIPIILNDTNSEVVLVVSGTARYTRQPAAYRFSIDP